MDKQDIVFLISAILGVIVVLVTDSLLGAVIIFLLSLIFFELILIAGYCELLCKRLIKKKK